MACIRGAQLVILTVAVSLGIFMNVLDTAIANVAIPNIAGNLGVSTDEGTWVITSFTVSIAIVLPLTGWLAKRIGEVRLFVISTLLFTIASVLCGFANSLPMLVVFRVIQGAVAGPMIPLSQSLLLSNYPPEKKGFATGLWAMVAVAAPVIGPILGGYITDEYSWPWIFYINIPVGLFSCFFTWQVLRNRDTPTIKQPTDFIGLFLLIVGIGSLQILLDKGKDLDWFNSNIICALAIASFVSLSFLIAWELKEKHPIVDLTLFKSRNFTLGTVAISLGYMIFFGNVVILPLWLQTQMNYTPTWAGLATAPFGILPILLSPIIGRLLNKIDPRIIISIGFFFFSFCSFWLASFTTDIDVNTVALIRFIQGVGAPCFFIPLITVLLSGLPNDRLASAAGLSNFLRLLGGSFGTSIVVTFWSNRESLHQSHLTESLNLGNAAFQEALHRLQNLGFSEQASYGVIYQELTKQAYMLATNDVFWGSGIIFLLLLILIWGTRRVLPEKSQQVSIAE